MGKKKPIIEIKLNPNKVITIEKWSVGPGGSKHNYKKYKETNF